jgi:hypothetical protein
MSLAGGSHLAVMFDPVTLGRSASALMPQDDRRGHSHLFQDVIRER